MRNLNWAGMAENFEVYVGQGRHDFAQVKGVFQPHVQGISQRSSINLTSTLMTFPYVVNDCQLGTVVIVGLAWRNKKDPRNRKLARKLCVDRCWAAYGLLNVTGFTLFPDWCGMHKDDITPLQNRLRSSFFEEILFQIEDDAIAKEFPRPLFKVI